MKLFPFWLKHFNISFVIVAVLLSFSAHAKAFKLEEFSNPGTCGIFVSEHGSKGGQLLAYGSFGEQENKLRIRVESKDVELSGNNVEGEDLSLDKFLTRTYKNNGYVVNLAAQKLNVEQYCPKEKLENDEGCEFTRYEGKMIVTFKKLKYERYVTVDTGC